MYIYSLIETLFVKFAFEINTDGSWHGSKTLKTDDRESYFNLKEESGEISIIFSSQINEAQSWSTTVFLKDKNQKPRHIQRNTVCGKRYCKYKIWKYSKKTFWQELQEFPSGELTFIIIITDLTILALHKDTRKEKCTQTSGQMDYIPCLDSLSLDLCSLLEDGSTSDVVLRSGNDKFPAHRAVLSSRSEFFSAMFRSDMREKREGFVDITDIDSSDLRLLLKYIYCGKVDDLTEELATRLYVVADKYAVKPLKKKCATFLVEMLTDENACSSLVLADTYNDPDFKAFVIDYIIENEEILNTDEWTRTSDMHPKLGVVMFRAYLRKQKAVSNETR